MDATSPEPSSSRQPRGRLKGRILLVDDDREIVSLLTDHLEGQGYDVIGVASAEEALHRVHCDCPDLVLLDVGLPGANGVEALRRIRRDDPSVGVIMITGNPDPALAKVVLDAGAFDHLLKPLDFERMDPAIRAAIGFFAEVYEPHRIEIVTSTADDRTVVALHGILDVDTAGRVKHVLGDLVEDGRPKLIVDLGGVTFIDSSGLGGLIAAMKQTRATGGDLRLCAPSDNVRTILEMTDLISQIRVYGDRQSAIDAWR